MTKNGYWTTIILSLAAIIAAGSIVAWLRFSPSKPIEISLPQSNETRCKVYIGGAVAVPGIYPFTTRDSIETLIQSAGGITGNANISGLKLYIPNTGKEEPQKIDLNRAETWLLEALPGIGETLAKRIVDYRQQNGPFRNTGDLQKVAGIDAKTYERIKSQITVSD